MVKPPSYSCTHSPCTVTSLVCHVTVALDRAAELSHRTPPASAPPDFPMPRPADGTIPPIPGTAVDVYLCCISLCRSAD